MAALTIFTALQLKCIKISKFLRAAPVQEEELPCRIAILVQPETARGFKIFFPWKICFLEPKVAVSAITVNRTTLSFSYLGATGDYKGLEICLHILYFPEKDYMGKTYEKSFFSYWYILINLIIITILSQFNRTKNIFLMLVL